MTINDSIPGFTDFSDTRVILHHAAVVSDAIPIYVNEFDIVSSQSCDGPTYIIVGRNAPGDKCARLATRYGLKVADVLSFRDSGMMPPLHVGGQLGRVHEAGSTWTHAAMAA